MVARERSHVVALAPPEFADHQLERVHHAHANRTAGSTVARLATVAGKSLIAVGAARLTLAVVTLVHRTLVVKIGVKGCA